MRVHASPNASISAALYPSPYASCITAVPAIHSLQTPGVNGVNGKAILNAKPMSRLSWMHTRALHRVIQANSEHAKLHTLFANLNCSFLSLRKAFETRSARERSVSSCQIMQVACRIWPYGHDAPVDMRMLCQLTPLRAFPPQVRLRLP